MPRKAKRKAKSYRRKTKRYGRRSFRRRRTGKLRAYRKTIKNTFPDLVNVRLNSTLLLSGATTAAGTGGYTLALAANSLFDPMGTGSATEQPTGLDQWSAFYTRYRVNACRVKVEIMSTDVDDFLEVILFPSTGIFTEASFTTRDPTTLPYCKDRMLYPNVSRSARVKHYFTTKKVFPGEDIRDGAYSALFTSDPGELWYFNLRVFSAFNPSSAAAFNAKINISQYATLYERTDLQVSTQ